MKNANAYMAKKTRARSMTGTSSHLLRELNPRSVPTVANGKAEQMIDIPEPRISEK